MRWLDFWKYGQMIRSLASGCFGEEGTGTGWRKRGFSNLQDETHIYNKVCLKLKLCNVQGILFKGHPSIWYTWNWGFGCNLQKLTIQLNTGRYCRVRSLKLHTFWSQFHRAGRWWDHQNEQKIWRPKKCSSSLSFCFRLVAPALLSQLSLKSVRWLVHNQKCHWTFGS